MMLAFAALVSGEWLAAMMCFSIASVPAPIVVVLSSMWGGRFLLGAKSFVSRPLPIETLLTLPSPVPQFPCRVEISKGGTMPGSDIGIVMFVDSWLHYEGHRTSFALRPCDVSLRSGDRLNLKEMGVVDFDPHDWLAAGGILEPDLKKRFVANLESWMRSGPPAGEPLLPPARFHPSGILRAWSNLATAVVSCVLVYSFLAWFNGSTWTTLLSLPFLLGLAHALMDVHRASLCLTERLPSTLGGEGAGGEGSASLAKS